jgi:hypothetical protein
MVHLHSMQLEHIAIHLERRAQQRGLHFTLGVPASAVLLEATEQRLAVRFPAQVKQFYQHYNGLSIDLPPLAVLALEHLTFLSTDCLHFATVNQRHQLCFNCSDLNAAGQWDIVTAGDSSRITLTMASFWSNKLWAWIDKGRPIWQVSAT